MIKDINENKQPRVRIEFDDIKDVPKVWLYGKPLDLEKEFITDLKLDWITNTVVEKNKSFELKYDVVSDDSLIHKVVKQDSYL